eukprot:2890744-Alexandrium_andersonii.AAC.1
MTSSPGRDSDGLARDALLLARAQSLASAGSGPLTLRSQLLGAPIVCCCPQLQLLLHVGSTGFIP